MTTVVTCDRARSAPDASETLLTTARPRSLSSRWIPAAGAFIVLFAVFFASPVSSRSDPALVPYTAQSLLADRDLDLSNQGLQPGDDYALVEDDGRVVSTFPWTTAALTTPIVALHRLAEPTGLLVPLSSQLDRRDTDQFQRLAGSLFSAAAALVLALLTARLLRTAFSTRQVVDGTGRVDGAEDVTTRWWFIPACTLTIGLATSLWSTASRGLWQHGPGVLMLGLAWLAAASVPRGREETLSPRRDKWCAAGSGVTAAFACGIRPTNVVFVAALVGYLLWRRRDLVVTWLIAFLVLIVVGVGANQALLGSPLPGYFSAGRVGFHAEIGRALIADLFSPSRGLLVFTPWLAIAAVALLPSRRRLLGPDVSAFAWSAFAASGASLIAAAAYGERWWAGHSYGPRFLTETVVVLGPLALTVIAGPRPATTAARLLRVLVAPLLIGSALLIHAPGATTTATECWNATPIDVDRRPSRVEEWGDPQFATGWRSLLTHGIDGSAERCRQ